MSNIAFITLSNNYWYNFYAKFPLPKVSSTANVLVNFLLVPDFLVFYKFINVIQD